VSRALARCGRLLQAAAGLAVIAMLLAGLPWGLARIAGSPLPRSWPGWKQTLGFFASPLTDDAIIRALADAAWLLWAVFAISLVIEVAAVIRGQSAPRLPAIAPVQALAAALVGATMMTALHVPRPVPRAAQPLHAALTSATSIAAPLVPGQPAQPDTAATVAAGHDSTPASRPRVYRVREGDDLWAIADRFLGDGEDWHDLYALNEGKPQPDGRALTDPDLILPGWVLLIPQPGAGPATASHPHAAHPASSGTRSPGDGHSAGPSSQLSRPTVPSARPSPSASRPGAAASPGGTPFRAAHPGHVAVALPTGALIGISVAIMVAAALTLAAIQRRRRYRPRPGPPSSLAPAAPPLPDVISALRRAARPALLAAGPDTGDEPDGDPYLDLYETAPEPGAEGDDAAAHSVAEPAGEPQPQPARAAQAERVPGTIPLGVDHDDDEVAVNLAMLGGLGLTGPGAGSAARAILASLLAQAPPGEAWLPAAIIPAADAARLLPGTGSAAIPGVSAPATLDAALDEMESLLLTLARTGGADDDLTDGELAAGAAGPGVVLIASTGQGSGRRLAGILEAGRDAGVAAVLLGASPDGVTCEVAVDGTVVAVTPPNPVLDGVRLFTLGSAEAAAIAGVLQEASGSLLPDRPDAPASPDGSRQFLQAPPATAHDQRRAAPEARPTPARAATPAPAPPASPGTAGRLEAGELLAPGDRPVQLSMLGPMRITAGGQEVSGGLRKARELLAYLAVHPDGASGEAIAEALWPEADPGRATGQRNLALRKARDMLRAATGLTTPMWILNASGRYRLDPALIATDLQAFSDALEEARQSEGHARLAACRKAVALYRGELADGIAYEWAEPFAETARRRALDAWTTIAEILQPESPDEALSALETALTHDPYNEYLYQRIMRLQAAAGRPEAVRRTLGLLESKLAELDIAPSPRTRQVAASLLGATGAPHRAAGPQASE
jgi:DNA-binding SARP family transcriptional activator